MTSRQQIKTLALRCLLQMDGIPMPQPALIAAIRLASGEVMESDINTALRELEAQSFTAGNKEEVTGMVTWTLTDKGQHKAKQLS